MHISNRSRQQNCDFIVHQNSISHVAAVDFEIRIRLAMAPKSMSWHMYADPFARNAKLLVSCLFDALIHFFSLLLSCLRPHFLTSSHLVSFFSFLLFFPIFLLRLFIHPLFAHIANSFLLLPFYHRILRVASLSGVKFNPVVVRGRKLASLSGNSVEKRL